MVDHAQPFQAPAPHPPPTAQTPEFDDVCISAYESCGIRWAYARGITTRPHAIGQEESFEQAADSIRALLDGTALTPERLFVTPVSIAHAAPGDFERSARLAEELGAGLFTHLDETVPERARWLDEAGAKPITALDRAGFLTARTVLAHCPILDDDEIELLARRRSHVVHTPSHNRKLAGHLTRVPDLLAAGVNVALGVDMVVDLFSEMRAELHMHSPVSGGPSALSSRDVLQMATRRGTAAVFPEAAVPADPEIDPDTGVPAPRIPAGELSPGYVADIVLIPAGPVLGNPPPPLHELLHALVHRGRGAMVRHVLVEGQLLVADGVSTVIDEADLTAEVDQAFDRWLDDLDQPETYPSEWFPPPAPEGP